MTLSRGAWVKQNGAVGLTAVELRRVDAACYYQTAAGTVRSGLLWVNAANYQLVTAAANMSYNLQPVPGLVIGRAANEGAYTMTTQGVTNITTGAAPAAGLSRWDLIYLKQNDVEKADADNLPVLGVVQGTAAASPTKPTASVPAGALVLAEAQIFSATAGTNASPNTLTQVWQYTALVGEPVPVRNTTERATLTAPRVGDQVRRLDVLTDLVALEDWNGTAWIPQFSYAEYACNNFGVSGGLVSWDAGPMALVPGNTWNNTFSNVAGALSGAVNISQDGFYSVQCTTVPTSNLGRVAMLLKNGAGQTLGTSTTDGIIWEVSASTTRWLSAGSYVRAVVLFQNGGTVNSSFVLMKHRGKW